MEYPSELAYYHAIKEYENKNYEEGISKLDGIIEIKNNNKLEYWAKYWRGCIYYKLGLDKKRKREPFAEVKHYFLFAKENFEEAKKISENILVIKNIISKYYSLLFVKLVKQVLVIT